LCLYGYAGLRPGVGDRPGGGRRQRAVFHHRARLRLWLQADAVDQTRHQQRDLSPHERGYGHQLRRRARRRLDRGQGSGDLRQGAQGGERRALQVRATRLRRGRIRAVADRGDDVRQALLFDLDGTLVDSDPDHLAAFQAVFAPYGIALDRALYATHIMGASNAMIGERFLAHLPVEERKAVVEAKEAAYRDGLGALAATP